MEVRTKNILIQHVGDQPHFSKPRGAKVRLAFNELKWIALCLIQTLPPSMMYKWKELVYILCKTTN